MTLREILTYIKPITINWHCTGPKEWGDDETCFVGYCKWDGEKLISLDGDDYSLDASLKSYIFYYPWNDKTQPMELGIVEQLTDEDWADGSRL